MEKETHFAHSIFYIIYIRLLIIIILSTKIRKPNLCTSDAV